MLNLLSFRSLQRQRGTRKRIAPALSSDSSSMDELADIIPAMKKVRLTTTMGELRLQKDLQDLAEVAYCSRIVSKPGPLHVVIELHVAEGPLSENILTLNLRVDRHYPHEPPEVFCDCKLSHPCLVNGRVVLPILSDYWSPIYDIKTVIYHISEMLKLDSETATHLMTDDPIVDDVADSFDLQADSGSQIPPMPELNAADLEDQDTASQLSDDVMDATTSLIDESSFETNPTPTVTDYHQSYAGGQSSIMYGDKMSYRSPAFHLQPSAAPFAHLSFTPMNDVSSDFNERNRSITSGGMMHSMYSPRTSAFTMSFENASLDLSESING
eukprot:GILJ01008542.1.p1 GENE.GILJ01008542.1~~GILJ01008542.1.p1  ORF type:complete len:327 (+),score=26.39 GILJ01008542.1:167-1147(+)